MKDPRRLLDDATLTEVERRSLTAALSVEPAPELVKAMWSELAVTAGVAGAAAGAAHAGAGSGFARAVLSGKLTVVKALVLGAAAGTVTTGSVVVVSHALHTENAAPARENAPGAPRAPRAPGGALETPETPAAPLLEPGTPGVDTEPVAPSVAPVGAKAEPSRPGTSAGNGPLPPARDEAAPVPGGGAVAAFDGQYAAGNAAPASSAAIDGARDEARLVGMAREALTRQDPATAMVILNETARRYPGGILQQEREALLVSALAATGRREEASAHARAFLRAFPNSPHAARVRAAVR